jgi:hypothetical protein
VDGVQNRGRQPRATVVVELVIMGTGEPSARA